MTTDLDTPTPTEPIFTISNDEKRMLRRFLLALRSAGVRTRIQLLAAIDTNYTEIGVRMVNSALAELRDVKNVEKIYEAGPSLELVVEYARHRGDFIPWDFIPSDELVKRAVKAFFAAARQQAIDLEG